MLCEVILEHKDEDDYLLVASLDKATLSPTKALSFFRDRAVDGRVSFVFDHESAAYEIDRKGDAIKAELENLTGYEGVVNKSGILEPLATIEEKLTRSEFTSQISNFEALFNKASMKKCLCFRDTTMEDGLTEVMFEKESEYLYFYRWE